MWRLDLSMLKARESKGRTKGGEKRQPEQNPQECEWPKWRKTLPDISFLALRYLISVEVSSKPLAKSQSIMDVSNAMAIFARVTGRLIGLAELSNKLHEQGQLICLLKQGGNV